MTPKTGNKRKVGWRDTIDLLHQFLPDDFPRYESYGGGDRALEEMEVMLYEKESGDIVEAPLESSAMEITNKYIILSAFAKAFSGDGDMVFWFANLPFVYNATAFVEQYAARITKDQMRQILIAFRTKRNSRNSLLRDFSKDFLDSKVDQFIADFKRFAEREKNLERFKYSFVEVEKATGLSRKLIRNLVDEPRLDNAHIIINVGKKFIVYEPNIKARE